MNLDRTEQEFEAIPEPKVFWYQWIKHAQQND